MHVCVRWVEGPSLLTWLTTFWCPVILQMGLRDSPGCHRNIVKSSEPLSSRSPPH